MEGFLLLLLFLVLWLVDRFLGAALRSLRAVRSLAKAGGRADATVEPGQGRAEREQQLPTMTKQR